MTGDEKEPRWVTIEKVVEVFYTDEVVSTGDPRIQGAQKPSALEYAYQQLESEYRLRVRAVIIEQLGLTELELVDTNTLPELGADSLDEIEIVMALEDEFRIEISDTQAEAMRTVNDVVAWLVTPR
jgi:acyl carrier protein